MAMKRIILFLFVILTSSGWLFANHWTPVSMPYESNMTLTGVVQVNGVEQQSSTLEVGAFCGAECRGSGILAYFVPTQHYVIQMLIYGETGDPLTFKLFDHSLNQELDFVSPEGVVFSDNGYGSLNNPFVLNFVTTHNITVSADPTVGGTVLGAGTYVQGTTATLVATPNEGYTFINWTLSGEVVSNSQTYSFTVTEAADYVAHFSNNHWEPNSAAYESNMTLTGIIQINNVEQQSVSFEVGVFCNDECRGTARPVYFAPTQHYIVQLVIYGEIGDQLTFKLFDHNSNEELELASPEAITFTTDGYGSLVNPYVLNFLEIHEITATVNPVDGGILEGAGIYNHFSICTLTAIANEYYYFVNWTLDGSVVSTEAAYSFEVLEDGDYVANFELNSYEITASATPTEGGTIDGAGTYNLFTTCTLTAIAATGYHFLNWTIEDDVVSTEAAYSFEVTGPANYVAHFELNSYDITATANPTTGGTVEGAGVYQHFSTCTLTATAYPYSTFLCWKKDGEIVSTEAVYSFTVTEEASYEANFELNSYEIAATANPGDGGTVTGAGTYNHFSTCTLTATANEGYVFVSWNEDGTMVSTEPTYSFTVTGNRTLVACFGIPSVGEYVDLGLPSGLLWATCNVGANTPEEYGDYFAWGETQPKDDYYWSTYQYCMGDANTLTKYCDNPDYGYNGFTDSQTVLLPEDDAATANWGAEWRMATQEEWQELFDNTTQEWTTQNGVNGRLFTAANGASLFLPIAGYRWGDELFGAGGSGYYWSSSLYTDSPRNAWYFSFHLGRYYVDDDYYRSDGRSVRAVRSAPQDVLVTATPSPAEGGTVTGAGSYSYGETCTLTATANIGYTFINWMLGDEVVSTEAIYSFTVTEEASYEANFELNSYEITATSNPEEGGTVTGAGTYNYGETCSLTAMANVGYEFMYWTDMSGEVVSNEPILTIVVTGFAEYIANFDFIDTHWTVNPNLYPDNMSITGIIQIDGVEQFSETLELGAFCNGECRGTAMSVFQPNLERCFVYLTVYGEDGDIISFRLFDHATGQEVDIDCASTIAFEMDAIIGDLVEPYVFNFVGSITQTSNFSNGWNWWSGYVEMEASSLQSLQDGLGTNGEMIKSQNNGYASYLAGYGWYGSLTAINNESTYQVKSNAACTVELTGFAANPEDHPITLNNGWSWAGYPVAVSMGVEDALAGITPQNGDMLKSQNNGYASYLEGYGWYGSLNTLHPGMGLMYKSNNGSAITLTYPSSGTRTDLKANQTTENNHWQPALNAYPDNMSVMAVVEHNGEELASENYELAAFANGEVRGSARLLYVEPLNRYMAFLTIAGDEAAELRFSLYNTETGSVETCHSASLRYETNAVMGSFESPYVVSFLSTTGLDEWAGNVNIFPNPVERGQTVSFGMTDVETSRAMSVEIIDALGVVVETHVRASLQGIIAPKVAGIYTLRITVEGMGTSYRKLVVE